MRSKGGGMFQGAHLLPKKGYPDMIPGRLIEMLNSCDSNNKEEDRFPPTEVFNGGWMLVGCPSAGRGKTPLYR